MGKGFAKMVLSSGTYATSRPRWRPLQGPMRSHLMHEVGHDGALFRGLCDSISTPSWRVFRQDGALFRDLCDLSAKMALSSEAYATASTRLAVGCFAKMVLSSGTYATSRPRWRPLQGPMRSHLMHVVGQDGALFRGLCDSMICGQHGVRLCLPWGWRTIHATIDS